MPVQPLPASYHRPKVAEIDDESSFTSSPQVTTGPVTWQVGSEILAVEQLNGVATLIEQLIQQDFSGPTFTAASVPAAGGQNAVVVSIVLAPVLGDPPVSGGVGTWGNQTIGMLASLASLIRSEGYGTTWTPPAP